MQALRRTLHLENTEAFASCCPEYIWYLAVPSPSSVAQSRQDSPQPGRNQNQTLTHRLTTQWAFALPSISCSAPFEEVLKLAHLKTCIKAEGTDCKKVAHHCHTQGRQIHLECLWPLCLRLDSHRQGLRGRVVCGGTELERKMDTLGRAELSPRDGHFCQPSADLGEALSGTWLLRQGDRAKSRMEHVCFWTGFLDSGHS